MFLSLQSVLCVRHLVRSSSDEVSYMGSPGLVHLEFRSFHSTILIVCVYIDNFILLVFTTYVYFIMFLCGIKECSS